MARTVKSCSYSRCHVASKKRNERRQRKSSMERRKKRIGNNEVSAELPCQSDLDKHTESQTGKRRHGASHQGQTINLWKEENMLEAIKEFKAQKEKVDCERLSVRGIARAWNVPYATFRKRIFNLVKGKAPENHLHCAGRPTVLSTDEEAELAEHLRKMAEIGFPCDQADARKLAYEFAQKKGISGFSTRKKSAGYYWFVGFLKRHPELSVKKSENLSIARAMGMNETQVLQWFQKYQDVCSRLGIFNVPAHIWNADETGCQNIQKSDKVIGESGKPTYNVTGGDKGETSTALVCVNALGSAVPPMIIHKGMKVGKLWTNGARHDVVVRASESAYINKELFVEFGELFVKHLRDSGLLDGTPHLLLLDSHYSHLYNITFLELMKKNDVHVMAIPAHTSHWLQPLDRGVFRSFKQGWQVAMKEHARGRKLEKREFFRVFNSAWDSGISVDNIQGGFRGCGLVPYNPQAIPRHAYTPSSTTERSLASSPDNEQVCQETMQCDDRQSDNQLETVAVEQALCPVTGESANQSCATVLSGDDNDIIAADEHVPCLATVLPGHQSSPAAQSGCSDDKLAPIEPVACSSSANQSTAVGPTFQDIMPFPKRDRAATRKRKKPPSYELTSDDTLAFVRAAQEKKETKTSSQKKGKNTEKATGTTQVTSRGKKKKAETEDQTLCTSCHHR